MAFPLSFFVVDSAHITMPPSAIPPQDLCPGHTSYGRGVKKAIRVGTTAMDPCKSMDAQPLCFVSSRNSLVYPS